MNGLQSFGNDIALYPLDNGLRYIDKGYNLNDAVYSIVSKNAEKVGQVRLYHAKVKKDEKKTLAEYNQLQKGIVGKRELKEMRVMRKAMIDDLAVDSEMSNLLDKPNRYQTQSEFIEQLFGYRELQGEGNIWFNRGGIEGGKPVELFLIPKQHLNLRTDKKDPWGITGYQFAINGGIVNWALEDVLMWKYANYNFDPITLEHLRGLAPLQSAMILIQSLNEGDVRLAVSNKHGGASGLAYREDTIHEPTAQQIIDMRRQFNDAVNSEEMANKIAILGGKWGYHNLSVSINDQRILEQYDYGFERLCRVYKTDYGLFKADAKYDNKNKAEKHWIYSKIAPNIYNLRGLLSDKLVNDFYPGSEVDFVDCDIMSLQELSEDLKDQVAALKDATWLSDNEKRDETGYEPKDNEWMDLTPLEIDHMNMTANLNAEEALLNAGSKI